VCSSDLQSPIRNPQSQIGASQPSLRLAALRTAFRSMMKDPEFLATCEKRSITLEFGGGEDMDAIVSQTMQTPKVVLNQIPPLLNQ
jgi:tripartite-type tricarboxylate transporter receptor subunit TctC